MNKTIELKHRDDIDDLNKLLREAVESGTHVITITKKTEARTLTQNQSLHRYANLVSKKMNTAGYTQRKLIGEFKDGFELPVTEHMIKDVFRGVGLAMYKKKSTADLNTVEISKVHRVVDMRFGEVTGITVAWPSRHKDYGGIDE